MLGSSLEDINMDNNIDKNVFDAYFCISISCMFLLALICKMIFEFKVNYVKLQFFKILQKVSLLHDPNVQKCWR